MEWADEGIVLGTRRHGEANVIVEVMTAGHGRHLGMVRGGAGRRLRPILQPGNSVGVVWRARLDEHLGTFTVEGLDLRAATFLAHAHALAGISHIAALCRLLPERDPHPSVHAAVCSLVAHMDDPVVTGALIVRFELAMLAELGFGLDLESCAATGTREDLAYVSPKSGRAVCRSAGAPWHDRLLPLPRFVIATPAGTPSVEELTQGFAVTGFFLERHVLQPRGINIADVRETLIAAVTRAGAASAA
jgi:DNA repair protein RecO (recombination protein O)